jgi:hypothetical protein
MSWIAHELSLSLDTLIVLSPLRSRLPDIFDELSLGLNFSFPDKDALKVELHRCPEPSPLAMWMAFSAGRKAGLQTRYLTLGFSLDNEDEEIPLEQFPGVSALVLDLSEDVSPLWERYFRVKIPEFMSTKPCVALGYNPPSNFAELPQKALQRWLFENFRSPLMVRQSPDLWTDALEWMAAH